jgi:hypothetical protein
LAKRNKYFRNHDNPVKHILMLVAVVALILLILVMRKTPQPEAAHIAPNNSEVPAAPVDRPTPRLLGNTTEAANGGLHALSSPPNEDSDSTPTNVTFFSTMTGFAKLGLPSSAHHAFLEKREAAFRDVVAKDIADEINAATRARESTLRERTRELQNGAALTDVTNSLGLPDVVRMTRLSEHGASIQRVALVDEVPFDAHVEISYWPRVGVAFDGRNGQGYKVLFMLFDHQRRLEAWTWQQPEEQYVGSISDVQRQQEYWRGKHEASGPPPRGAF